MMARAKSELVLNILFKCSKDTIFNQTEHAMNMLCGVFLSKKRC